MLECSKRFWSMNIHILSGKHSPRASKLPGLAVGSSLRCAFLVHALTIPVRSHLLGTRARVPHSVLAQTVSVQVCGIPQVALDQHIDISVRGGQERVLIRAVEHDLAW